MPAGLYAYRQGWLITCSLMAVWIHIHDHRDIMGRWGSLKIQLYCSTRNGINVQNFKPLMTTTENKAKAISAELLELNLKNKLE